MAVLKQLCKNIHVLPVAGHEYRLSPLRQDPSEKKYYHGWCRNIHFRINIHPCQDGWSLGRPCLQSRGWTLNFKHIKLSQLIFSWVATKQAQCYLVILLLLRFSSSRCGFWLWCRWFWELWHFPPHPIPPAVIDWELRWLSFCLSVCHSLCLFVCFTFCLSSCNHRLRLLVHPPMTEWKALFGELAPLKAPRGLMRDQIVFLFFFRCDSIS